MDFVLKIAMCSADFYTCVYNVLYGEASPLSLTPYPLIHIFLQKSYAFRNPDIKNGTVVTCFHKNTASLFYSLVMKLKMIMSPFPL